MLLDVVGFIARYAAVPSSATPETSNMKAIIFFISYILFPHKKAFVYNYNFRSLNPQSTSWAKEKADGQNQSSAKKEAGHFIQ